MAFTALYTKLQSQTFGFILVVVIDVMIQIAWKNVDGTESAACKTVITRLRFTIDDIAGLHSKYSVPVGKSEERTGSW